MKHLVKTVLSALLVALLTVSAWAEMLLIAPAPKTGDRMNMPLLIGLIAVVIVAIVVVLIIMLRNNKKQ